MRERDAAGAGVVIDRFQGRYRFLSNFYGARLVYEDITYPSSEHAFQAGKTLRRELRVEIASAPTPYRAKQLGRTLALRPGWNSIRNDVMLAILRIKFAIPAMKRLLLETGDAQLVEGNDHGDTYWGVCQGRGENWLGKLIMQVREEPGR